MAAPATKLDDADKLTDAERKQLDRNHARSVRLALAAESKAHELVGASADDAVRRLVDATTGLPEDERQARRITYAAIAAGALWLQQGSAQANRSARRQARQLARAGVGAELRPVQRWIERKQGSAPDLTPAPAPDTFELDGASSDAGARTLANRFNSLAIAAFVVWRRSKEPVSALPARLKLIRDKLEPQVRFQARNHAFDAFNDEKRGSMRATLLREPSSGFKVKARRPEALRSRDTDVMLKSGGGLGGMLPTGPEQGLPYGWGAVLFEAWSAILDRKTCTPAQRTPNCWELDGNMVPFGKEFPGAGRPQLHLGCRCMLVSIFVPRLLEKRLPGAEIDYAALKDDVKAHMMASKDNLGEGIRHAERFLRPVLSGKTTSPEALVRAFSGGLEGYFPNRVRPVIARVPRLPPPVTSGPSGRGKPSPPRPPPPRPKTPRPKAVPPKALPTAAVTPIPGSYEDFVAARIDVHTSLARTQAAAQQYLGRELTSDLVHRFMGLEGHFPDGVIRYELSGRPDHSIELAANIRDRATGKLVGRVDRTIDFGRDQQGQKFLQVHNDYFKIDPGLRGQGIGNRVIARQMRSYQELGVKRVFLDAAWDGQYKWPRMGYRLQFPQTFPKYQKEFARWLESEAGYTAAEAAAASSVPTTMHELAVTKSASGRKLGEEFLKARGREDRGLIPLEITLTDADPDFTGIMKPYLTPWGL